ncbi:MAG: exonuclease 3'-5' domain-containing protein 2 isoform X1 [Harvfovirus sp.]|uniref:Exonuclease 3'-5' domain-containing protein 2 isoform X1 n=1 Tax=Harvfovirus sp. TaxID=2487768 RepID=A0A3G5A5A7_9VIRU|nr:MAG: exonuclease 3'-5' domain-containing protein 2 isoform X1 [Harvfovirus sp.]
MAAKKPYDNFEIYSPDNELLGFCARAKFDWYLTKNLAEKFSETQLKLKFEPNYRTQDRDPSSKRLNICYVCLAEENLQKFHIIPSVFKKKLPIEWKSHNSSDILPLCEECATDASREMDELRRELEDEFEISDENFIDKDKVLLKSLAKKILGARSHGIVEKGHLERMNKILGREVTNEELEQFSDCDVSISYMGSKSSAEHITKQFIEKNKIKELMLRWKQHFIDRMNPMEIPEDYFFEKTSVRAD